MAFFAALGVNLQTPVGKAVFFNDRLGVLLVKATESDLDTIERAIQVLNDAPPDKPDAENAGATTMTTDRHRGPADQFSTVTTIDRWGRIPVGSWSTR